MGFKGKFFFESKKIENVFNENLYSDKNIEIEKDGNFKFHKDILFFEHDKKIFLLDGVILNNHELEKEYKLNNWKDTFIKIYEEDSLKFLNKLRGSFYGLIYDIEDKKLKLFTDQLKSKSIFYSLKEDEFIFSTSLSYLASLDKKENILDEEAAYLLLTFGGTLEERTLFKNIRKLNFATILEIDYSKNINKSQYWMFDNTEDFNITENEAIDKIDELFRKAIKREYDKDLEYGYNHLVCLSAGRDSRMNTWVAHELGYQDNVLNITFSESDELDETIPKQIARDLKHEWIFKSLDNGNCVYNIEEVMKKACGEVHYGTLCHSNFMMKNLNLEDFGLLHTGQVGDLEYYGDNRLILSKNNLEKVSYIYSKKLLKKVLKKEIIKKYYKNEEIFNHINRGIHVTCESSIIYPELQIISPFLDIDFMQYCLKIPNRTKIWSQLYDKWIVKKYPKAAKYTHNGRKIGEKEIKILGRNIPISQLVPRILRKIGILKSKKGMNPFDEWYKNNSKVREILDNYFKENIKKLGNYEELKKDCEYLYNIGSAREKTQVITLLAVLKLYFDKKIDK